MATFESESVAWVDPYIVELTRKIGAKRGGGDSGGGLAYDTRYGDTNDFGSGGALDLEDETQRAIFEKFEKIHDQREHKSVGSMGVLCSGTNAAVPKTSAPRSTGMPSNPNIPGPRVENLLDGALDDPYTHIAAANDTFVAISGKSGYIHFFDKEDHIQRFSLKLYGAAGLKDSGAQVAGFSANSITASNSGISGVGFFSNLVSAIEGGEQVMPIDPRDPVVNLLLDPLGRHAVVIFASGASILYHIKRQQSNFGVDDDTQENKKKSSKKSKKGSGQSAADFKPIRYNFNINSEANGIAGFVLESIGWNISNNAETTTDTILFGSKYGGALCSGRIGVMGLTDARPLFSFPAPYNKAGPIQSIAQFIDDSNRGGARASIVLVAQGHRLFYFSSGPVANGNITNSGLEGADTSSVLHGIFSPFANVSHLTNFLSLPTIPAANRHHAYYSSVSSSDRSAIGSGGSASKGRAAVQQETLSRAIPVTSDVHLVLPFAVLSQRRQQDLNSESNMDPNEGEDARHQASSSINSMGASVMRYGDTSKRIKCLHFGGAGAVTADADSENFVTASEIGADSPLTHPPICFTWSYDQWYVTGTVNLGVATAVGQSGHAHIHDESFVPPNVDEVGVAHLVLTLDLSTGPAVPVANDLSATNQAVSAASYSSPYFSVPSKCLSVINVIDLAALIGGYESLQWQSRVPTATMANDGGNIGVFSGIAGGLGASQKGAGGTPQATAILTSSASSYSPASFYSLDRILNARSNYFHTFVITTRKQYTLAMPPYLAWEAANLLHVMLDTHAPAIVANQRNMMHTLHVPSVFASSAHQYIHREQKMLSACVSSLLMSVTASETSTRGIGKAALAQGSVATLVNIYRPYTAWPAPSPALAAMGKWSGAVRALSSNTSPGAPSASGFFNTLNPQGAQKTPQELINSPTTESYNTVASALAITAAHETRNRIVHEVSLLGHAQRLAVAQFEFQNVFGGRSSSSNRDRSTSMVGGAPPTDAAHLQEYFANLSPIAASIGSATLIAQTQAASLCPGLAASQGQSQAGAGLLIQFNPRCSSLFNGAVVIEPADIFRYYILRYAGEGFSEVTLLPHRKHFAKLLVASAKRATRAEAVAIQLRRTNVMGGEGLTRNISGRPPLPPAPREDNGSIGRMRSPSLSKAQAGSMRLPGHRVLSQGASSVVPDGKGGTFTVPVLTGTLLFNMALMLLSSPLRLCRQDPFSRSHFAVVRNHLFSVAAGAGANMGKDNVANTKGISAFGQQHLPSSGGALTHFEEEDLLIASLPSVRAAQGALMMNQSFLDIRYQFAQYLRATGRPLQAARHFAQSTAADTRYHLHEAVRATTRGKEQKTPYAGLAAANNSFNSALTCLSASASPTAPLLVAIQEKCRILNRTRSEQNKAINTNVFDEYADNGEEEDPMANELDPLPTASPELHCLNTWAAELLLHHCATEEQEERLKYRLLAYQSNETTVPDEGGEGAPNRSLVANSDGSAHYRNYKSLLRTGSSMREVWDPMEQLLRIFYGVKNASNTLQNLFKRSKRTLHWCSMKKGVFAMGIDSAIIHFCTHMKKYAELLQYQISNGRHFEAVIFLINFCSDDYRYYNSCWVRFSYDLIREYPVRLIQEGWIRKGNAMGIDPLKLIPAIMAYRQEFNDTRRYAEGPAQLLIEEMENNRLMAVIRDQIVLQKAIDKERTVPIFRPYGQIYRPNLQRSLQRAVVPPKGLPSRRASLVGGRVEAPRTVSVFNGMSPLPTHTQKARSLSMLLTKASTPAAGRHPTSFGENAFSSLAVAREQVPEHQGVLFLKHVLKPGTGAASNVRSDPLHLLRNQCLYNLLLHLLATSKTTPDAEVVSFIESTPTLDKTYAYRVCMANERFTAALQILFSLGYLHESVEQALLLRDVGLAVAFIKKIRRGTVGVGVGENGRSIRRELWKKVIAFVAEDKVSGAQFALNLIAESKGDVNVSHVLPFLSDEVNVSAFKTELDENVRIFGNDLQTLQASIAQSERETEALKAEQRYESSLLFKIDQKALCAGCGQLVLSRRNAVFFRRCRHAFHATCYKRGCINVGVAKQLLDLSQIGYVEGHMHPPCEPDLIPMSNHRSSNTHRSLQLLGNGTEEIQALTYSLPAASAACPNAGIQQGFFPAHDAHEKKATNSLLSTTEFRRAVESARELLEGGATDTINNPIDDAAEEYVAPSKDCTCYLCDPSSAHVLLEAPLILPITTTAKGDISTAVHRDMRL